jgi:hypothetical protein
MRRSSIRGNDGQSLLSVADRTGMLTSTARTGLTPGARSSALICRRNTVYHILKNAAAQLSSSPINRLQLIFRNSPRFTEPF